MWQNKLQKQRAANNKKSLVSIPAREAVKPENENKRQNRFLVAIHDRQMEIRTPPIHPFSPEAAMELAAWLVATAQPYSRVTFQSVLAEVETL